MITKKITALLLAGLITLSVAACNGSDATTATSADASEVSTSDTTEASEPKETSGEASEETSEDAQPQIYSVAGMSSDELFNLITGFADLKNGDSIDNITSKFPVEPTANTDYVYMFANPEGATDYIRSVKIYADKGQNDTVSFGLKSRAAVIMNLSDMDLASDLYGKLFDYISQQVPDAIDTKDNRDGTHWHSEILCEGESDSGEFQNYGYDVSLEEAYGGGYLLTVTMPFA